MDAPTFIINALQVNATWMAMALDGLTDAECMIRPHA